MDKWKLSDIARRLAEESMVLLKNEGKLLPLRKGSGVAFLGRGQLRMVYSGSGSGSAGNRNIVSVLEACGRRGLFPVRELAAFYQEQLQKEPVFWESEIDWSQGKELVNSGLMYEIFGRYHPPVPEYEIPNDIICRAASLTGTAILILTRNSGGEECDRRLAGDYELTESEKTLICQACRCFDRIVLVLNTNGLIDLGWTELYPQIQSILWMGIPGEEGANALAGILTGSVSPSGKLPVTIAKSYGDYPTAVDFSCEKDLPGQLRTYESYGLSAEENGSIGFAASPVTVYREDIYAGYRYFDSFGISPLFPFGYGLSYTSFTIQVTGVEKEEDGIRIFACVCNTGSYPGKEALQLYTSADTGRKRAVKELKGVQKTRLLEPGASQRQELFLPWEALASYCEREAAWVIEAGDYTVFLGNSSRNLQSVAGIGVTVGGIVRNCANRLSLKACNRGKISFLCAPEGVLKAEKPEGVRIFLVSGKEIERAGLRRSGNSAKEKKIKNTKIIRKKVQTLSDLQKACLLAGYGPGTAFSAFKDHKEPETLFDGKGNPVTVNDHPVGVNGYISPAIPAAGIHSVFYKDGPAGIGRVAWPSQMFLAASFDTELLYEFGDAVGAECEEEQVNVWLGPALNLHRNPLCGRNFEYYSEDPYLTGICGMAVVRGVQENHPVLVCPKHFAANEQETFRRGSSRKNYDAVDSILTERAARELYLKPFQMLVEDGGIFCLMTSFNKINSIFAGGNSELCTAILRDEWGYQGVVVTDWGDMDIVVDGADAVRAGNDVVMPGGPPVIAQILCGLKEGRLTQEQLDTGVENLLRMLQKAGRLKL